jgi:hypothetical protein
MRGKTLWTGVLVLLAAVGAVAAREPVEDETQTLPEAEIVLDLGPDAGPEMQPMVDCSDERPDDDCLSGRLGSDQATQACNGIGPLFGSGNCSVHCAVGYYACGRCGLGGLAKCTCRENFTCNPYAP